MMKNIPQEKANKILDMACERACAKYKDNELLVMLIKLMMLRITGEILENCSILGAENVAECYRAAIDAVELMAQEIKKENEK